jgi:hypothetical protein
MSRSESGDLLLLRCHRLEFEWSLHIHFLLHPAKKVPQLNKRDLRLKRLGTAMPAPSFSLERMMRWTRRQKVALQGRPKFAFGPVPSSSLGVIKEEDEEGEIQDLKESGSVCWE